jgi:hypothetical protein
MDIYRRLKQKRRRKKLGLSIKIIGKKPTKLLP